MSSFAAAEEIFVKKLSLTVIVSNLNLTWTQVEATSSHTEWGTGGMSTKLTAARIATAAGCKTAVCLGSQPGNVEQILRGAPLGTVFFHHPKALKYASGPTSHLQLIIKMASEAVQCHAFLD